MFQFAKNGLDDSFDVVTYLGCPESQNTVALVRQNTVANFIVFAMIVLTVLAAVDLNGNSSAMFGEVEEVASKRNLPPEMITVGIYFAQPIPELSLQLRSAVAKSA